LLLVGLLAGELCSPQPSHVESWSVLPSDCESATPDARSAATNAEVVPRRSVLFEKLGVRAWHAAGLRGRGIKVAVLDSGFSGYRKHLGKALPRTVEVRSFRFDGDIEAKNSQHGILCAEVIHALAPEAELLLVNWEPEHPAQFLAAARWARKQGARIISCSVIMPTWSDCEGHGRFHEELTRILGTGDKTGDVLFFASAGNTALRHWCGSFQDDGDGYHVWKRANGAAWTENSLSPWGRDRVSVELCCAARSDLEVIVTDATTRQIVGRSRSLDSGGYGNAVVGFMPEGGHEYRVRVRRERKTADRFHLVVLGGGLRFAICEGSIPFPGDGREVLAVGAVDHSGRRFSYSSCGPRRGATKPEFVAAVPFPSDWRIRPFTGTSAAAPQAAALAALLWSHHTEWNAQRVRETLTSSARPCSSDSPTWEMGRGLIHLPNVKPALPFNRQVPLTER
jgi:subtilisin family serine protease